MKFRDYKSFSAGNYYHIFNRGVNKQKIFLDKMDYLGFLKRIRLVLGTANSKVIKIKPLPKETFEVISYCLMPNHYHMIIKQCTELPISTFISKITTSYVSYFNHKYERIGQLFQDAFKAKLIDSDEYVVHLSGYIHTNPEKYQDYDFSSLKEFLLNCPDICNTKFLLDFFNNEPEKYLKYLNELDENSELLHNYFENVEGALKEYPSN